MKNSLRYFIAVSIIFSFIGCSGQRVKFDTPTPQAVIDKTKGRNISAEAGGFQLLLFIPIKINSRHERAYQELLGKAGPDSYVTDIKVTESWTYGLIGTAYWTKLDAIAYPKSQINLSKVNNKTDQSKLSDNLSTQPKGDERITGVNNAIRDQATTEAEIKAQPSAKTNIGKAQPPDEGQPAKISTVPKQADRNSTLNGELKGASKGQLQSERISGNQTGMWSYTAESLAISNGCSTPNGMRPASNLVKRPSSNEEVIEVSCIPRNMTYRCSNFGCERFE
jgi:hypothetical protein